VADSYDRGDKPLGSIKYGEFLEWLRIVCFSGRTLLRGVADVVAML
jgi:hypothetical protein